MKKSYIKPVAERKKEVINKIKSVVCNADNELNEK